MVARKIRRTFVIAVAGHIGPELVLELCKRCGRTYRPTLRILNEMIEGG